MYCSDSVPRCAIRRSENHPIDLEHRVSALTYTQLSIRLLSNTTDSSSLTSRFLLDCCVLRLVSFVDTCFLASPRFVSPFALSRHICSCGSLSESSLRQFVCHSYEKENADSLS